MSKGMTHGLTEIPAGYWHCATCKLWICPTDANCPACGKPSPITRAARELAAFDQPTPGWLKWTCPVCDLRQKDAHTVCEACKSPRLAAPVAVPGRSGAETGQGRGPGVGKRREGPLKRKGGSPRMTATERRFSYRMGFTADHWRPASLILDENPRVLYTPDFRVGDTCYEVKGSYRMHSDNRSRTAFLWARQRYPHLTLEAWKWTGKEWKEIWAKKEAEA